MAKTGWLHWARAALEREHSITEHTRELAASSRIREDLTGTNRAHL